MAQQRKSVQRNGGTTVAKYCSVCGKKFGLLDGKIVISDGIVCSACWTKAGLDMGRQTMQNASKKTIDQIKDLIEIEALRREAEKKGIKPKTPKAAKSKKVNTPDEKSKEVPEQQPIDIYIDCDKNNVIYFWCEGHPVINFDDIINEREMIIGDGFIRNESATALPAIRIACKFDPEIADPGALYYEAGTFEAGIKAKFEIDDPPVNLEKYAKIKRTRKGKISFTIFLEEQEMGTVECEMQVKPAPAEELQHFIDVREYLQRKNAPGPVNVFLDASKNGAFEIDLMQRPSLLYALYSNGFEQLIGDVFINNESSKTLQNVSFEAKFTSDILSPVNVLLGNVPAGKKIRFGVEDPAIDLDKLERLTEIETCMATYSLRVNGKLVAEASWDVIICPYDQWNGALPLLPAYMTPNHPDIISVLKNASKWMRNNGMNPSLEGYQSDSKRVEEMVGAVYNALKAADIVYSNPPASFFGPQRIRLCGSIFEDKFATCMDMTILFASCLESFGLHPVLITAPRHIFAGVWLTARDHLQERVVSDAKLIQKYIADGQLIAVECTGMNSGKDMSYEEAKKMANAILQAIIDNDIEDHACIDVQIVRADNIRPLPIKVHPMPAPTPVDPPAPVDEPTPVDESTPDDVPEVSAKYIKEEYKEFSEDLSHISIDNFYDKESKRLLKNAIAKIVAVEGPISQPSLIKTLINTTSLGRANKQVVEYLDNLVSSAGVKITRQSGVRFLWDQEIDPSKYLTYRFREKRDPEDICKYELKNAVCYLIQNNGPMTQNAIIKEMTAMFGYSRTSPKITDTANAAIKAARDLKAIELNEKKQFVLV